MGEWGGFWTYLRRRRGKGEKWIWDIFEFSSALVPCLCFENAVFMQFSELSYIKSVSDQIGSNLMDTASRCLKPRESPVTRTCKKNPISYTNGERRTLVYYTKSVFYEPVGSRGCLQGCVYWSGSFSSCTGDSVQRFVLGCFNQISSWIWLEILWLKDSKT